MHTQPGQRRGPQRLPRNQQRERVLRLVGAADGAVDAAELAERMQLHVTTVRFHLDALCDLGAVARTRIKRDGVGRPRTGYVAVRDRLDYRNLAEILAMELGDTVAERAERAERVGRRWADRILAANDSATEGPVTAGGSGPDAGIDDCAGRIAGIFARMGFSAELAAMAPDDADAEDSHQRTILLHACPVYDLARAHPEVSCAMHLGVLRGLLNARNGAGGSAELKPFVEPEMCVAKVIGH
ncbi:transcriptional regulator [Mycolicibacter minnesotensis]|uniref:Transcriptional regulator n=1 Tax=Mycolicibacter minnesotensis TaxID=1118379 RepID=A0A7I7R9M0_9MYCO|nr:transcriptional regulator [Mycolicibacter minnesotensis]ORA98875.1 transcriptional regulator [Mycolicibacter minnesotensis]BBY34740.1 ArsR family transcriptional regulator [Mycolicibacter minnesotensis]